MSENAPMFKKSSFSFTKAPWCVEVAHHQNQVLVRDSKNQAGPVLSFSVEEWDAFLKGAKAGEFDKA